MNVNMISSPWRVALLYNLRHPATLGPDAPADALADYDTQETVDAVAKALVDAGHLVIPLEADHTLLDSIRHVNPDICFNMARGIAGDYRASQIPALLDMLAIPYTGSDVLTLAMTYDKAAVKRVWKEQGLPTAPFQVFRTGDEEPEPSLGDFPYFVKPLHGKAGMGIGTQSIVENISQLRKRVRHITYRYQQPAVVEAYLPGREFTAAVIGSNYSTVDDHELFFDTDGYHVLPVLEIQPSGASKGVLDAAARMPPEENSGEHADFTPLKGAALAEELSKLAITAFEAVNALDVATVDIRLDAQGRPHLLSISALPALEPRFGYLAQFAEADDLAFETVIQLLLDLALKRYALATSMHSMIA